MHHGDGGPEAAAADAKERKAARMDQWAKWVAEHADEAADLAAATGWRPEDIPRECAAVVGSCDCVNLRGPVKSFHMKLRSEEAVGPAAATGWCSKDIEECDPPFLQLLSEVSLNEFWRKQETWRRRPATSSSPASAPLFCP